MEVILEDKGRTGETKEGEVNSVGESKRHFIYDVTLELKLKERGDIHQEGGPGEKPIPGNEKTSSMS